MKDDIKAIYESNESLVAQTYDVFDSGNYVSNTVRDNIHNHISIYSNNSCITIDTNTGDIYSNDKPVEEIYDDLPAIACKFYEYLKLSIQYDSNTLERTNSLVSSIFSSIKKHEIDGKVSIDDVQDVENMTIAIAKLKGHI